LSPISIPHHIPPKPQPHNSHGLSTAITSSVPSYTPGINTVYGLYRPMQLTLPQTVPKTEARISFATLVPTYLQGVFSHKMKLF
jgi:hypothetical protein